MRGKWIQSTRLVGALCLSLHGSHPHQGIARHFEPQCRTTCPLVVVFSLRRPSDAPLAKDGPVYDRHYFSMPKTLSCSVWRIAFNLSVAIPLSSEHQTTTDHQPTGGRDRRPQLYPTSIFVSIFHWEIDCHPNIISAAPP